jgi:hypothetical protein
MAMLTLGGLKPPAINTFQFGSSVAVWTVLALLALPVGAKVPACAAAGRGRANRRSKMALGPAQPAQFFSTEINGVCFMNSLHLL